MDLQKIVERAITDQRNARMEQSDQLTLGELIEKVQKFVRPTGDQPIVKFDFEYYYPGELISWRGSYAELSLTIKYDGEYPNADAFIAMLKGAVGKEFQGYKGGDYVMSESTPVWVANHGNSGNTAVVGVIGDKYEVIILTGYREF